MDAVRVGRGPAFSLSDGHIAILRQLTGTQRECTDKLIRVQWLQDVVHQAESKAHFDNCDFAGGRAYVVERIESARKSVKNKDVPTAITAIGQALHAIQDFYAHSNYVEMMAAQHADFASVRIVPIWTDAGGVRLQELIAAGLVSGRVWWGAPKRCADSVKTHGEMAKDHAKGQGAVKITKWESM